MSCTDEGSFPWFFRLSWDQCKGLQQKFASSSEINEKVDMFRRVYQTMPFLPELAGFCPSII